MLYLNYIYREIIKVTEIFQRKSDTVEYALIRWERIKLKTYQCIDKYFSQNINTQKRDAQKVTPLKLVWASAHTVKTTSLSNYKRLLSFKILTIN
jgi:hypothetical protein